MVMDMNFNDFDQQTQLDIKSIIDQNLVECQNLLQTDKYINPMLAIKKQNENDEIVTFDDQDAEDAFDLVLQKLQQTDYTFAKFVFSAKILARNGDVADAIKTYVITKKGEMIYFVTPYAIKGLFKKKVFIGDTILEEITENVFE